MLADLYHHSLVDTGERSATGLPTEAAPLLTVAETEAVSMPLQAEMATGPLAQPTAPAEKTWKFLGDNKKNILILVQYSNAVHIPDEELAFLTQLLSACKLSLGDIALLNLAHHRQLAYKEALDKLGSQLIFLYGIEPAAWGLPISFPHFQLQPFAGRRFLYAPALEEIREDKLLKTKLWVSLKPIFGV